MREILIFEPSADGHRMHFVHRIVEALSRLDLGPLRLVTTPRALEHEATQAVISCGGCKTIDTVNPETISPRLPYSVYWLTALHYQATRALAQRVDAVGGPERFRLLFLPFIDATSLAPLALGRYPFGALPFSGIAIHPTFHLSRVGVRAPWRVKNFPERLLYQRLFAHRHLHSLFSVDPFFADYAADPRVFYIPEPAEFSQTPAANMRDSLGIPKDAVVVLLYGSIDGRKGFGQLIRALARTPPEPRVVLLAAGRQYPELIGPLPEPETTQLRQSGRLVEFSRFITPEEERAVFDAADIVWVCYSNRNIAWSGAMLKAGLAGKPVISAPNGISGQLVRTHGLGVIADANDPSAIANAIGTLCDADLRSRLGQAGRKKFEEHTPARFLDPIIASVRALDSTDAPHRRGTARFRIQKGDAPSARL